MPQTEHDCTEDEIAPSKHEEAIAQAYRDGEQAGAAACAAAAQAAAKTRDALRLEFAKFDDAAIEELKRVLAETVASLCQQMIEPHLVNRKALEERCDAALSFLGEVPTRCKLHLHPDDIADIDPATARDWKVVPDSTVARGALRLVGDDGIVSDGPEEWQRAIATALAS
ncbi:FliH/SctL family protein [Parerythrobacter jejuensis]|uniref:Flagellar assembly protein FliH n=1 Tax=Parerythrobacter jejuensis TaxID=795812 RepID=A0A845AN74_9SPHN|nr:FliH/SctL family protein [Parerythrobacter jejuensis]MXP30613.1 hypothetical protein [Parerythrobacter jejuensis]MXP33373.1 hypothetical protein [Parerythrobacter jejuensis]